MIGTARLAVGTAWICLALALGACQSLDSILGNDAEVSAQPTVAVEQQQLPPVSGDADTQAAAGAGAPAGVDAPQAAAQTQTVGAPQSLQAAQQPANAPAPAPASAPQPEGQPAAGGIVAAATTQTAAPGQIPQGQGPAAQGSLAEAARAGTNADAAPGSDAEAGDTAKKITVEGGSGGFASGFTRRFDSLFGAGDVPVFAESEVGEKDVVGRWQVNEEDGLRTCSVAIGAKSEGSQVVPGADCSGLAAQAKGWGLFGADLLLHNAENTVVARLKRSGTAWVGFTLDSGIPVVFSRTGG